MRIFLLGAGYIGMALLQQSDAPEITFWASTTTESKISAIEKHAEKGFVVRGSNKEQLEEIIDQCDGMVISVAPSSYEDYREAYFNTAETISHILQKRKSPFYLLYTGSTSVYGDHQGSEVDENSERRLSSDNAKILADVEDLYLSCSNENVTPCVLRLGGIYGPGRDMADRARRMSGQELGGSGEEPTNNSHREDIVSAIVFCLKNRLEGVYNVVSSDHPNRKELYRGLCKALNLPEPSWNPQKPARHGSNCIVSNKKIRSLGFDFKHPKIQSSIAD